jgi:hypothetical protein
VVDFSNPRIHSFRSFAVSVWSKERNARAKSGFVRDQCPIVATILASGYDPRQFLGPLPGSGPHCCQQDKRAMRSQIERWELHEGCDDWSLPGGRHSARALFHLARVAPSPVKKKLSTEKPFSQAKRDATGDCGATPPIRKNSPEILPYS